MRIALTSSAKFTPFTFDELLKPYAMVTQEYNTIEEGINELGTKAELMRMYANEDPNSRVAKQYNDYANQLDRQAEELAKNGLTPSARTALLNLKKGYATNIVPIETAVTRRRQLAEEQRKARAQDSSIMFDVDARTMKLDDLVYNPEMSYTTASGTDIMNNVSKAASALAKEARNNPNYFNSLLGGDYYEYVKQKGFSSQAVLDAINRSPNASAILTNLVDSAVASSGVTKDWVGRAYDRAYDYANRGLWSAVGPTETQLTPNWRAQLEAKTGNNGKGNGSGKKKGETSNVDRTSYYFPKDRDELPKLLDASGKLLNNPYTFGIASSYKDLVNDLFKDNKFTEPKTKGTYVNRTHDALAYYTKINNVLLNSGFNQETINSMNKETVEKNLKAITELNAADAVGRNLYRFALDDNATGHLIDKLKGRGMLSQMQELQGLKNGIPIYSNAELEYEEGQAGDILFDASSRDFILLNNGRYYKLPKGMISTDLYDEIDGYLSEDMIDDKKTPSMLNMIKQSISYLNSKENLSDREKKVLNDLYNKLDIIDSRLGTIGNEFMNYVGTRNIN